jgi:hypothetical protein
MQGGRERERLREFYLELAITGGLGRRPRTDSGQLESLPNAHTNKHFWNAHTTHTLTNTHTHTHTGQTDISDICKAVVDGNEISDVQKVVSMLWLGGWVGE